MKTLYVFTKSLKQSLRDPISLALTLLTAPAMALFYGLIVGKSLMIIHIGIINLDRPSKCAEVLSYHGKHLVSILKQSSELHEQYRFEIDEISQSDRPDQINTDGLSDLVLVIPHGLSETIECREDKKIVLSVSGDLSQIRYYIAKEYLIRVAQDYVFRATGKLPTMSIHEKSRTSVTPSPFTRFLPGLIVMAIIMLTFSSSMAVAREIESGALLRLRMAGARLHNLLIGMSMIQLIEGTASLILVLLTAYLMGFRSNAPLLAVLTIIVIGCMSCIGIGLITASLSKNVLQSFLFSSVAMFIQLMFSGIVFDQPHLHLFKMNGYAYDLFDLLPTVHLRIGLYKMIIEGSSWEEILHRIIYMGILSIVLFLIGAFIFRIATLRHPR